MVRSTVPFKCGEYARSGRASIANDAAARPTALARNSLPRSKRIATGTPPMGPLGASMSIAARSAPSTVSWLGVTASAQPRITRHAWSTNNVAQGITTRPSGNTTCTASWV